MQESSICRTCLFYDEENKYCREHFAATCAIRVESNLQTCSRYKDFNTMKWKRWWREKRCVDCLYFKSQKSDKNQDKNLCNHCLACKTSKHFLYIDHKNNACYLWTPRDNNLDITKHRI